MPYPYSWSGVLDAAPSLGTQTVDHTEGVAYVEVKETSGANTYYGRCRADSSRAASDPIWQIWKATDTTGIWADGNTLFDNIWANRASLVYPGVI